MLSSGEDGVSTQMRMQREDAEAVTGLRPAENSSGRSLRAGDRSAGPQDRRASAARLRLAAGGASDYGPNNQRLPERLQEALRRLVFQYSTESESTRREEIRRIKQAHQFWRGLQYLWWNERDQNWHLPFEQKLLNNSSLDSMPRYEFVTNIYQAFGLSLVSVLSQDVPRVRFFPTSAQAEEDVAAAKAATEVAQLVERNNRIGNLIVDEAFNLWTDGKVGAYVRFVVDGQRFGFHPETEIAAREVRLGADMYICPECSAETPVGAQHAVPGDNTWRDPAHSPQSQGAEADVECGGSPPPSAAGARPGVLPARANQETEPNLAANKGGAISQPPHNAPT